MRIVGVDIPDDKRTEIALTYIFGVGRSRAGKILSAVNIDPNTRAKDLTAEEGTRLKEYIEKNYSIEGDLKRQVRDNIKRKKEIESYEGIRHRKNLPVRGQQTKTNNRTVRGNVRKTAGSGKIGGTAKT